MYHQRWDIIENAKLIKPLYYHTKEINYKIIFIDAEIASHYQREMLRELGINGNFLIW